jgi:RNA polymerase-binding transcription factor
MALKKSEIQEFKKRLEQIRDEITHSVRDSAAEVKIPDESKGYSQHQADEGTDDFIKTINLEVTNKECDILRQIDRALEKIEDGTYGYCDVTQEEIPRARLEAIPYATMTVRAQEMMEKGLL